MNHNAVPLDISGITLSEEQEKIFHDIETSDSHFYITGKAGTGKSLLLQYLRYNTSKSVVVAAPTGISALNIGGQTIHSLFGIVPGLVAPESSSLHRRAGELLRHIDMVIIDEVSMVRADLMDAIDHVLRMARRSSEPFGGVKLIMFGDLFQLPPVVDRSLFPYFNDMYGGFYFFDAMVWRDTPLAVLVLTHIFRQKDAYFKMILNGIRSGNPTEEMIEALNSRANLYVPSGNILTLATTNAKVHQINAHRMANLPTANFTYEATVSGALEPSAFPTEAVLNLKQGAQVMMLKNDKDRRWVNGSIGRVYRLTAEMIEVEIDGHIYEVKKEKWAKIRYVYHDESNAIKEEPLGSFTQFPLRLAWAVTIHKAQGLTYDTVVIDLGIGAFAHGQTYVALSRCTSLEGLYLTRPVTPRDVIVDQRILDFEGG
jgi:ATP-dependent exoDNAse (exonuclease V) alpha subunit